MAQMIGDILEILALKGVFILHGTFKNALTSVSTMNLLFV
jgi:hypothetical protein